MCQTVLIFPKTYYLQKGSTYFGYRHIISTHYGLWVLAHCKPKNQTRKIDKNS